MSAAAGLAGFRIGLLTAWASRRGGGVFEAVVRQAEMIRAAGGEARVFALDDANAGEDRARLAPAPVIACDVMGPAQVGFAPALSRALVAANLDCLHLHGIWMYPSRAAHAWARRTRRPLMITPHGMMDPWITARGRWKKALARRGYERAAWRDAYALHALTAKEAEQIRAETGRGDSLVIANPAPPLSERQARGGEPHVIYIGRIHAKKNLIALIEGWDRAALPPGSRLILAGWGDPEDIAALERAVAAAAGEVAFEGPVFGERKAELLASARFVILPSLSEGLPLAILESWAAGVPTIMTAECNLPEGFAAGAALECGYDAEAIAAALERALAMPRDDWRTMAAAARALAAGRFSASEIGAQWSGVYRRAIDTARTDAGPTR